MVKEISKSVEDLINSIDNTINVVYNSALLRSDTCATKWARVGKPLASDVGEEYYLSGIEPNEWVKAGENELDGTYYLPKPYFIGGTKIATNREWTLVTPNLLEKTPIIWLLYDLEYKNYGRGNTLDWETNIRLFFLDETDVSNYYTKDHTDNVVIPMSLLAEEFIKVVEEDRNFLTLEEYDVINFTRFGAEQENGYFKNILDANLSGVELRIKLSKYKNTTCKC